MKIYDISMTINENIPVYKNKEEKKPNLKVMQDFSSSSHYESRISMDIHTGTHMDAPLHMIENGDTIDNFDLNKAVTKCKVLDLTNVNDKITADNLKHKNIEKGDFILLKTKNSFVDEFDPNFIFVDQSGAEYLKNKGIIGVGIDSLGIERSQPGHETHKILLGNNISILEGLRLKDIEAGEYLLICPPLKIQGAEGAPVRALLVEGL